MSAGTQARPVRDLDLAGMWLDFGIGVDIHLHAHELCPAVDDIAPVVELVVGTRDQVALSATADEWPTILARIGAALAEAGVGLSGGAR